MSDSPFVNNVKFLDNLANLVEVIFSKLPQYWAYDAKYWFRGFQKSKDEVHVILVLAWLGTIREPKLAIICKFSLLCEPGSFSQGQLDYHALKDCDWLSCLARVREETKWSQLIV